MDQRLPDPETILVAVAHSSALIRESLSALLAATGQVRVVSPPNGQPETEVVPDVVVSEFAPRSDVLQQLRAMTRRWPQVPVVALGNFDRRETVGAAIGAGARACVSSHCGGRELVEAVRAVHEGRSYLCPVASDLRATPGADDDASTDPVVLARPLTQRERQILALIAEGCTDRETAHRCGLSLKTVHNHRRSIMVKLGVHNATSLVRRAMRLGLIDA